VKYHNFLEETVTKLGKPLAPNSINRKISSVSSFYQFLLQRDVVDKNPVEFCKRPKRINVRDTEAFNDTEMKEFFRLVIRKAPPLHKAALLLLFTTGMRNHELRNIKLADFENREGIKVLRYIGKGQKVNHVPIHPVAGYHLGQYLDYMTGEGRSIGPNDYLFQAAKVNINYHVSLDEHFYSVPYQLVQKTVTIRYTANTVEILHGNKRVASHQRSHKKYGYSTLTEHMPAKHSEYAKWTPEQMGQWAGEAGPSARQVAETLMTGRLHPQQGFNSVLGIIRLGEKYGKDQLERACARALYIKSISLKTVRTILSTGMDNIPIDHGKNPDIERPIDHENIRGPSYYN
jgi:integrase